MLKRKSNALLKPVLKAFLDDRDCAVACTILAHTFYPDNEGGSVLTVTRLIRNMPNCKVNYLGLFLQIRCWDHEKSFCSSQIINVSCYYYSKSRTPSLYILLILFYHSLHLLSQFFFILRVFKHSFPKYMSTFTLAAWYEHISSNIFYLSLYSNLWKSSKER
jgi:hypothetical protein